MTDYECYVELCRRHGYEPLEKDQHWYSDWMHIIALWGEQPNKERVAPG